MFDMNQVAGKIKEARLIKNMTQMQLADEMGVSYQAVSNWERGNSMPDISKLTELSSILDISIDALLGAGRRTDVVKKIINEDVGAIHLTMSEFEEVIPIVPPDQTNDILGDILEKTDTLKLSQLIVIAPFVKESYLANCILKVVSVDNIHEIAGLAPFLSHESLRTLMTKLTEDYKLSELVGLAPFLESSLLDELVRKRVNEDNSDTCTGLLPFLSQNTLKMLTEVMVSKGNYKAVAKIAPFL